MGSDLSEYEQRRLENIRRNQAMLASMGLAGRVTANAEAEVAKTLKKASEKASREKQRKRRMLEGRKRTPTIPTRSSKRIRAQDAVAVELAAARENDDATEEDEEAAAAVVDYTTMPMEPEELDDFEFQVYCLLRAWRLKRKRELQIEPYKIFQNRTLCESVRRRRNDAEWAGMEREGRSDALLDVWGIGPSKVHGCKNCEGGWAHELVDVMGQDEVVQILDESRRTAAMVATVVAQQKLLVDTAGEGATGETGERVGDAMAKVEHAAVQGATREVQQGEDSKDAAV